MSDPDITRSSGLLGGTHAPARSVRDDALLAIASYLAEGDISGQVDEGYYIDQAEPYLEALDDCELMVVRKPAATPSAQALAVFEIDNFGDSDD